MSHVLRIGVVDQIAYFRAFNTDGSGKADLTSATTGLTLSVFRVGLASVSIASLSDKAADNTAHADGAIRNVGGNLYTVDLPDAATANQCPSIGVKGSYTGGVIEPVPHPIVNYDPAVVAVGANTTTPLNSVSAADMEQLRHRIGIDGTAAAPSTATGAKLGDVLMTRLLIDASASGGVIPLEVKGNESTALFAFWDIEFQAFPGSLGSLFYSGEDGTMFFPALETNLQGSVSSVSGNVQGKVLGGGAGTITGVGASVDTSSIATATKAALFADDSQDKKISLSGGGNAWTPDSVIVDVRSIADQVISEDGAIKFKLFFGDDENYGPAKRLYDMTAGSFEESTFTAQAFMDSGLATNAKVESEAGRVIAALPDSGLGAI